MYYKITNKEECHHDFQYVDGLNVLKEEFNDNPEDSCCSGGLYFTDAEHIFKFVGFGVYVREVTLPTLDYDFKMIKDKSGNKWRANKIILGRRYDLFSVDTIQMLISSGANIHANYDVIFRASAENSHVDIVKLLIDNNADIHVFCDCALSNSARNGHYDVVKLLLDRGANIHADGDFALRISVLYGHTDIVKLLLGNGSNVHAYADYLLRISIERKYRDIERLLEMAIEKEQVI